MRTAIRAIPAFYKGQHFRSTLESRWACFFETLGTPWEYEPKRHTSPGQSYGYTPDFHLPDLGLIIEVKPAPVADAKLVDKYMEFGPELVRRGECRLFMFGVGYPQPGMELHGWWKHGERGFRFEPIFGSAAVVAAAHRAKALEPEQELVAKASGWCQRFVMMSVAQILADPEFQAYLERERALGRVAS